MLIRTSAIWKREPDSDSIKAEEENNYLSEVRNACEAKLPIRIFCVTLEAKLARDSWNLRIRRSHFHVEVPEDWQENCKEVWWSGFHSNGLFLDHSQSFTIGTITSRVTLHKSRWNISGSRLCIMYISYYDSYTRKAISLSLPSLPSPLSLLKESRCIPQEASIPTHAPA